MGKPPFQKEEQVGKYTIQDTFSVGGMGVVYLVKNEKVLIKTPFADSLPNFLRQFQEEVEALKRLSHPGIVKILDHGAKNGIPWYAMEKLEGESLRDLLKRKGRLPPLDALRIEYQIVCAMAYAHSQEKKVWHLDLKPENVCFQGKKAVILDFGLAQSKRDTSPIIPTHGTLEYMSPEQLVGYVDSRTDVYSLGIILYEMISGTTPFGKRGLEKKENAMEQILDLSLPSPRLIGVDDFIAGICEKALQKKSELRYADATEMVGDIKFALRRQLKAEAVRMEQAKNYQAAATLLREAVEYGLPPSELEEFWRFRIGKSLQVMLLDQQTLEAAKRAFRLQKHPHLIPILELIEGDLPYLVVEAPTTDPLTQMLSQGYYLSFRDCIELCKAIRISIEALKKADLIFPLEERRIFPGTTFRIAGLHCATLGYKEVSAKNLAEILVRAMTGKCDPVWTDMPDIFQNPMQDAFKGSFTGDAVALAKSLEDAWDGQEKKVQEIQKWKARLLHLKAGDNLDKQLVYKLSNLASHDPREKVRVQAQQALKEIFGVSPENENWERFVANLLETPTHLTASDTSNALSSNITHKIEQFVSTFIPSEEETKQVDLPDAEEPGPTPEEENAYVNEFVAFFKNAMQNPAELTREKIQQAMEQFLRYKKRERFQTKRVEKERLQLTRSIVQKEEILQDLKRDKDWLLQKVAEQEHLIQEKEQIVKEFQKKQGMITTSRLQNFSSQGRGTQSPANAAQTPTNVAQPPADAIQAGVNATQPQSVENNFVQVVDKTNPLALGSSLWDKVKRASTWYAPYIVKMAQMIAQEWREKGYAKDLLQSLLEITPNFAPVQEALASLYWQEKDFQSLIALYEAELQYIRERRFSQSKTSALPSGQDKAKRNGTTQNIPPADMQGIEENDALEKTQTIPLEELEIGQSDSSDELEITRTLSSEDMEKARKVAGGELPQTKNIPPEELENTYDISPEELENLEKMKYEENAVPKPEISPAKKDEEGSSLYALPGKENILLTPIEKLVQREVLLCENLAQLYNRLKNQEKAISLYTELLDIVPTHLPAIKFLQDVYLIQKKWQKLLWSYEKEFTIPGLKTNRSIDLRLKIAVIKESQLSDYEGARESYEAILHPSLDSNNLIAIRGLQSIYTRLNNWPSLERMLLKETEIQKDRERLFQLYLEIAHLRQEKLSNHEGAIEYFQKVYLVHPNDIVVVRALKDLYQHQKNWGQYTNFIEKEIALLKSSPTHFDLHYDLMKVYHEQLSNSEQAISHGESALALKPDNLDIILFLEQLYTKASNKVAMAKIYAQEGALLLKTSQQTKEQKDRIIFVYFEAGKIYQELGETSLAIDCFQKVIESDSAQKEAFNRLSTLLTQTKQWDKLLLACELVISATDANDRRPIFLQIASLCEKESKDYTKSMAYYRLAYESDRQNVAAVQGLRRICKVQERWAEAIDVMEIEASLVSTQHKPPLYFQIGEIWEQKLHSPSQAIASYFRVLEYGFHGPSVARLMRIQKKAGDWRGLAETMEKDIRNTPITSPEIIAKLLQLGEIYKDKLRSLQDAKRVYSALLQLDPKHSDALRMLETVLETLQDWNTLITVIKQRILISTENLEQFMLHSKCAQIYEERLHLIDLAILHCEKALEIFPNHLDTIRCLERLYDHWGLFVKLVVLYGKELSLVENEERLKQIYRATGNIWHTKLFDTNKAIADYQKLWIIDPCLDVGNILAGLYRSCELWEKLAEILPRMIEQSNQNQDIIQEVDFRLELGKIYCQKLDKQQNAIQTFQQVLDLEPLHDEAFALLSSLYEQQGNLPGLINLTEQRLDLLTEEEEIEKICLVLGRLYEKSADLEKAVSSFCKVTELHPNQPDALRSLDKLYESLGSWDLLIETIDKETLLDGTPSQKAELHFRSGDVYQRQKKDNAQAQLCFQKALEIFPTHIPSLKRLADIACESRQWEIRAGYLCSALEYSTSSSEKLPLLLSLGHLYREKLNLNEQAIQKYEDALNIEPNNLDAIEGLIQIYTVMSRWADLEVALARFISNFHKSAIRPESKARLARVYHEWGKTARTLKNSESAVARYTYALELCPQSMDTMLALADSYYCMNRWLESWEAYRELYEIQCSRQVDQPDSAQTAPVPRSESAYEKEIRNTLYRLAILEEKREMHTEAIGHYEKLLEGIHSSGIHEPLTLEVYQSLASLYMITGNPAQAFLCWDRFLDTTGDNKQKHYGFVQKALIFKQTDEPKKAIDLLLQAFQYDSQDALCISTLTELYILVGDFEKAQYRNAQHYSLLQDNADKVKSLCTKGYILWKGLGQNESASEAYSEALKIDPGCVEAIQKIGEIYTQQGKWKEASTAYQAFLSNLPPDKQEIGFPIRIELGYLLHEKLNDLPEALRQFQKALELHPEHTSVQVAIAEIKTKIPATEENAIGEHFFLLFHDPFRVPSYQTLVSLLAKYNRTEEALYIGQILSLFDTSYHPADIPKSGVSTRPVLPSAIFYLILEEMRPIAESIATSERFFTGKIPWNALEPKYGIAKNNYVKKTQGQNKLWERWNQCLQKVKVPECRLYVSSQEEMRLSLENAEIPSLILSQSLLSFLSDAELDWIFYKFLFYVSQRQTLSQSLQPEELKQYLSDLRAIMESSSFEPLWIKATNNIPKVPKALFRQYQSRKETWRNFLQFLNMLKHPASPEVWNLWQQIRKSMTDGYDGTVQHYRYIKECLLPMLKLLRISSPSTVRAELFESPNRLTVMMKDRQELWSKIVPQSAAHYQKSLDYASNHLACLLSDSLELSVKMIYLLARIRQGKSDRCPTPLRWEELKKIDGIGQLLAFYISPLQRKWRKST